MTICPVSHAARPNPTYTNIKARQAQWMKDNRNNNIKVTRLSICNFALEMGPTLCGVYMKITKSGQVFMTFEKMVFPFSSPA